MSSKRQPKRIPLSDSLSSSLLLATESLRANPGRAALAVLGIVIGIVTVSLVATVLVNVRNQVGPSVSGARHRQRIRVPPERRPLLSSF